MTATITDNGSNFIKAFRLYGAVELNPTTGIDEAPQIDDDHEENWLTEDEEGDGGTSSESTEEEHGDPDKEELDFIAVTDALREPTSNVFELYRLPPHRRCACHTLSLIATTDVSKITDKNFNMVLRTVTGKLKSVWNKQSFSPKASDLIISKLGALFVLPVQTRWNSFYDSLVRVKRFIVTKNNELREVYNEFKLTPLRQNEEEFVLEFVQVMRPLAQSLDLLQADKHLSIGYLLPTLTILQNKLQKIVAGDLQYCKPLVTCITNSITRRFAADFTERELRLAAMSHPSFKLSWIAPEDRDASETFFRDAVADLKAAMERNGGNLRAPVR